MRAVLLAEDAAKGIVEKAQAALPSEVGGILVGVRSRGEPWVTHAPAMRSTGESRLTFAIPRGARPLAVDELRSVDPRLGYVGEWHSHPGDVGPSYQDRRTMRHISLSRDAECPEPLLLIARLTDEGIALECSLLTKGNFRPLRIVSAGNLSTGKEA